MHSRDQTMKVRGRKPVDPILRLMRRTEVDDDGCWQWMGGTFGTGYGQIGIGSRTDNSTRQVSVHRVIYEHYFGKIPNGLTIDHLCRNKLCVNPHHLEPVTLKENVLRGESSPAQNARKTHCIHGHRFNEKNTYIGSSGQRQCKSCGNIRATRYYKQNK